MLDRADAYAKAVEAHGWDGAWYRRAYFDDGTPLGSADGDECRIDAIAQSWSVITGAGDPSRSETAMRSFEEHLVMDEARLIKLLTPAFDKASIDPGYIKGYVPGVRENGAQYTHAALWSVLATAMQGRNDRAFELFQMINPLTRTLTPEDVATYRVEPYVVAADVYSAVGQLGRGGWTWYTGSASWMYRVGHRVDSGLYETRRRASHRSARARVLARVLDRVSTRIEHIQHNHGQIRRESQQRNGRRFSGRRRSSRAPVSRCLMTEEITRS
jgi:cyclic beta-1,2-glucan synthetase